MRQPDRILRMNTVLDRTGLSKSTLYRKMRAGTFPPKIRISITGTGWRESDIDRWVANPTAWGRRNEFDFDD